jgi:hypothetical protein
MSDTRARPQFTLQRLFEDPTPGGLINQRLLRHSIALLDYSTLDEKEREQFFRIMLLVSKKLVAVWTHKSRFISIEATVVEKVREKMANQKILEIEVSQELFLEFDGFLVQMKSALDYLVHVPVPVFGRKSWSLRTFGNKGDDVLKVLRRNLSKDRQHMVSGMKTIVFDAHRDWLQSTINARDRINHYLDGGVSFEQFAVFKDPETGELHTPMWSADQSISAFLDVIWINLFSFVEDFVTMILYFRVKPGLAFFHGHVSATSAESPWKVTTIEAMNAHVKEPGWSPIQ